MKRVLVVFNDVVLLSIFKRWLLRSFNIERLLCAKDGKKALEIITGQPIELVISDFELPDMSGLELVSTLSVYYPGIKAAFFLPLSLPINNNYLAQLTSLYFIHKPESLKDFIRFHKIVDVAIYQTLPISDILLADILKLIVYQKKTCLVEIVSLSSKQQGFIYFEAGVVHDAVCGDLKKELAILEILAWRYGKFIFKDSVKKSLPRKMQYSLIELINNGNILKEQGIFSQIPTPIKPQSITAELTNFPENNNVSDDKLSVQPQLITIQSLSPNFKLSEELYLKICALQFDEELELLQNFDYYLGFAIFDLAGQLITKHQKLAFMGNIVDISQYALTIMHTAIEIMPKMGLGYPTFVQINSYGAVFQLDWIIDNQLLAIILLNADVPNTGLVKLHLDKACHAIRTKLS